MIEDDADIMESMEVDFYDCGCPVLDETPECHRCTPPEVEVYDMNKRHEPVCRVKYREAFDIHSEHVSKYAPNIDWLTKVTQAYDLGGNLKESKQKAVSKLRESGYRTDVTKLLTMISRNKVHHEKYLEETALSLKRCTTYRKRGEARERSKECLSRVESNIKAMGEILRKVGEMEYFIRMRHSNHKVEWMWWVEDLSRNLPPHEEICIMLYKHCAFDFDSNIAYRRNYSHLREEAIDAALVVCYRALGNFETKETANPFNYFRTVITKEYIKFFQKAKESEDDLRNVQKHLRASLIKSDGDGVPDYRLMYSDEFQYVEVPLDDKPKHGEVKTVPMTGNTKGVPNDLYYNRSTYRGND